MRIIAICLLMASAAYAQAVPVAGGTAFRIGHYPDGHSAWMTAGHGMTVGQQVTIPLGDDDLSGVVVAQSEDPDLALIAAPAVDPAKHAQFTFAETDPSEQSDCVLLGSGEQRRMRRQTLRISDWKSDGVLIFEGVCQPGDSGGPITHNGKCVGVLFSRSVEYRKTFAVSATKCRQWIRSTGLFIGVGQAGQVCPNGQCPLVPRVAPRPPAPQPLSVQPRAATCDCKQRFAAYESRIACLEEALVASDDWGRRIHALEQREPTVGPPGRDGQDGQDGPPGPAGRNGSDGTDAIVSQSQLETAVAAHLKKFPPVVTVVVNDNGKEIFRKQATKSVTIPVTRSEAIRAK
jgi:hypothetical protein